PHLAPRFSLTPPSPLHLYPLSLHDALPISRIQFQTASAAVLIAFHTVVHADWRAELTVSQADLTPLVIVFQVSRFQFHTASAAVDRKSTRLNSSHVKISYAVFCLKKKKKTS